MEILSIDPGYVNLAFVRLTKSRFDGSLWYGGSETHTVCQRGIAGGNEAVISHLLEFLRTNGADLCNCPRPDVVLIERQGYVNPRGAGGHRSASLLNQLIASTLSNYFLQSGLEVRMVMPATRSRYVLNCSNALMKKTRVRHYCKNVVRPAIVNGSKVKNEYRNQHECDALVQGYLFLL